RSGTARLHQSSGPAGGSDIADAGGEHADVGHQDNGDHQPRCALDRKRLSIGYRGADSDQPAKRNERRRHRPAALLSRRSRSARDRKADFRRTHAASQQPCKELIMRHATLISIAPLLLLLVAGDASAHAELDRAEPRVGNKVASPPRAVTLWFTQKLEPAFSSITVTNAAGERVDTGKTRVNGSLMSVSLRAGASGTYCVNWPVLSVDTHPREGNFTFRVGQ